MILFSDYLNEYFLIVVNLNCQARTAVLVNGFDNVELLLYDVDRVFFKHFCFLAALFII